jgi:hypothetical protein
MNVLLTTALTNTKAFDGTEAAGTSMAQCYLAGSNGSRIDSFTVRFTSTNAATASGTTAATLVRFWLNNGADHTTATNNQLLHEVAIAPTNLESLGVGATPVYLVPINKSIPAGYKIYAGSTKELSANAGALLITTNGGDY